MEEKVQVEEGISLLDLIKLLFSKIKILILVVLIGGILGGCFAIWRTIDINYFGTRVEFYVNPEKPKNSTSVGGSQYGVYGAYGRHVMDNIVKLLGSESFAEQLMMEDNGLPAKGVWSTEADDKRLQELYNDDSFALDLDKKIDNAQNVMNTAKNAKTEAENAQDLKNQAVAVLNEEWKEIGKDNAFNEFEYNELDKTNSIYSALVDAYKDVKDKTNVADMKQKEADDAQEKADEVREIALKAWRLTSRYETNLSLYKNSVSYTYLESGDDVDDANNLARSFIYVKITVLNNKEFAELLLTRVKREVPIYVEANMAIPEGYSGTNCQRITRSDNIRMTNPGYTTNQAIKYGILVAAAAFVVACVIIIIVDKSDKRLRDYETVMKNLNVPVLGVVPTIESIKEDINEKNKAAKVRGKLK